MDPGEGARIITGESLKEGGPWGLLALALGVIAYLFAALRAEVKSRLTDWKEIGETVKANTLVMSQWTASNEARTRALEASVRSQELAAAAQASIAANLGDVVDGLADVKKGLQGTREALLQGGIKL